MKLILGQRKVQVIGGSFLITLPKPWITTHEMKQGDPVLVELQSDDSLRISCILPSQSKPEEPHLGRPFDMSLRMEWEHKMQEYLNNNPNNENVSTYCGECFKPIETALDRDARRHFSKDLFCQCGRGS